MTYFWEKNKNQNIKFQNTTEPALISLHLEKNSQVEDHLCLFVLFVQFLWGVLADRKGIWFAFIGLVQQIITQ